MKVTGDWHCQSREGFLGTQLPVTVVIGACRAGRALLPAAGDLCLAPRLCELILGFETHHRISSQMHHQRQLTIPEKFFEKMYQAASQKPHRHSSGFSRPWWYEAMSVMHRCLTLSTVDLREALPVDASTERH